VEQELPARLSEAQIAELVEHDEVQAREVIGQSALPAVARLGLETVDQVDDVVEAAAGPGTNAAPGRMTSAECTPWAIASAQAASTAGKPSVSTAERMSTNCRLQSSAPASLRRTRSIAAGSTQSLKGVPLRKAPGLRASTGT
jgi:hypothetical protein